MAIYGGFQLYLGMAKEATPGTPLNPARFLPVDISNFKHSDTIKQYEDKAARAIPAATFGHYMQTGLGSVEFSGPLYPDDPGAVLYAVMGGNDTITAAPAGTTLSASGAAGATSVSVASATGYVKGMAILLESGVDGKMEGNVVTNVSGTVLSLAAPTRYAHASGAVVAGNNTHSMLLYPSSNSLGAFTLPPSYTLTVGFGEGSKYYAQQVCESWSLKWTAETDVTYTAKFTGNPSLTPTQAGLSAPSSGALTTVQPFVGWQSAWLMVPTASGSLTQRSNLLDLQMDVKRTLYTPFGANNQQGPTAVMGAEQSVTGKATFVLTDENEYNTFRRNNHPEIQFAIFGPSGFPSSPSAAGLLVNAQNVTFTNVDISPSKGFWIATADWAADYNTTDQGNCQVWLTNGIASGSSDYTH